MGVFSDVRRGVLAAVPAATVAVLSLTGLISVAPAYAATGHPLSGRSAHPDDDHLGSTIRAHEPSTVNPQVVGPQVVRPNASGPTVAVGPQQLGMDVSNHQGVVGWASAVADGAQFVYIKATEGTGFLDGQFDTNYAGSYNAGLIRGAYHFALPDVSTGVVQANYFADHGGGWSADGRTLPPMLDIEYDPYSADPCYGLSGTQMSSWIRDFSATVQARTGRYPTIYTTARWWNTCTAQNTTFGDTNPLFVACYCSTPGSMPAGWGYQTIWQYNDQGLFPGDQDVFNGSLDQLRTFATASQAPIPTPPPAPAPAPAGSVQVLPGSAEAGGVIGISVTGWSPNTTLSLTLDGTGLSSTVTTHDDGSAIVVLNVAPDTSVGTHTVLVAATSTKPVAVTGSFQVTALVPFSPYQILSAVLRFLFGL